MSWLRVDDDFLAHPKTLAAVSKLGGPKHLGRVAAVWLEAGLYASRMQTDGFIPEGVVDHLRTDRDARGVLDACVEAIPVGHHSGLAVKVEGGYQLHDFLEYNPSAEGLRSKREREKLRKQTERERRRESRNGHGDVTQASASCPRGQATDKRGQSCDIRPLARARDPLPLPRTPEDQDQEQRRERAATFPQAVDIPHHVLVPLAHAVLDDVDAGRPGLGGQPLVSPVDAEDEMKWRAARAQLGYDGRAIAKAIDSARVQRQRRRSA